MRAFALNAFRAFALLLALWTGAGIHDSLSYHVAWYSDPVAWASRTVVSGTINAWPFTTMALLLATIVAALAIRKYSGPGKTEAVIALGGTGLILIATLAWFVPQLGSMFGDGSALTEAELISRSHLWIMLNAVRQLLLVILSCFALLALGRMGQPAR